jgi:hypothetical protein
MSISKASQFLFHFYGQNDTFCFIFTSLYFDICAYVKFRKLRSLKVHWKKKF